MQELILEEKTTLSPVMKEIYRRLRTNLEFTGIENKVSLNEKVNSTF